MRLSAPTNRTFYLALSLLVLGVALWVTGGGDGDAADVSYWLTAAGGGLLVLGTVFSRI